MGSQPSRLVVAFASVAIVALCAIVGEARAADATAAKHADPVRKGALPSVDSIGTDTDIRAFLAPGVPEEVRRAALRRAWTVDPSIRDFVGLSGDVAGQGRPLSGDLQLSQSHQAPGG